MISKFYCPLCKNEVDEWQPLYREVDAGVRQLEPGGRLCPHCGSYERTRQIWIYLNQEGVLKNSPRFLHFAPERGLVPRLREVLNGRYITVDLSMPNVDQREDITQLTFADDSFDFIYCSNVLEHVEDDRAAMGELFRVLAPGGIAVIQVPIKGQVTYENPGITSPAERYKHFGQVDHVRFYGEDIQQRLEKAGFVVDLLRMPGMLKVSEEEIERMNIRKGARMYKCEKTDLEL